MTQYDSFAKDWEKAATRELRKFTYDYMLQNNIVDLKDKRVLDLACGEGYSSRFMKGLGAREVVGVDISNKLIQIAKKNKSVGIKYFVGDLTKYDFCKRGKFDVVTVVNFLHYLPKKSDFLEFFSKVNGCLNVGGIFYILAPNPETQKGSDMYGVKQVAESNKEGSKVLVTLSELNGTKFCEFVTYWWKKETILGGLQKAGFSYEWLPSLLSPEGISKYGEKFWAEYRKTPIYIMLKATKTG